MRELFPLFGGWSWWIIAGILLLLELAAPGVFFIWLAAAAAALGIVGLVLALSWQIEIALFAVLAIVFLLVLRPRFTGISQESQHANLNQRMYDYVGRSYVLHEPIVNGRGKIKVEDTVWEVVGSDRPRGEWVTVTGVEGLRLRVEPAPAPT